MKYILNLLLVLLIGCTAYAQTDDARSLTREGVDLTNQLKFTAAIEKFKAALVMDTDYAPANYQLAFALSVGGNRLDAISYLQKVVKSTSASANLISGAYDLTGSIYDHSNQLQKAIEAYKEGAAAYPSYQPLQYDLGLAYFRNKQYADAEARAIASIKLDSKHASSMRLYALVCFHQNKRAAALLGFCSFLMLETTGARNPEAYGNVRHLLQGGTLKPEPGEKTIPLTDADNKALNQAITQSTAPFANRRYASSGDLLTAQLTAIFNAVGTLAAKQNGNDFFRSYQAAYFYRLAQSPNMPAFARLISQSTPESAGWIKDHPKEMTDLNDWLNGTGRGF